VLGKGRLREGYLPGDALIELEGRSRLSVGIEGLVLFGILVREGALERILGRAACGGKTRGAGGQVKMREDSLDGDRIRDEGDDPHGAVAVQADQREALEEACQECGPSPLGGRGGGLGPVVG